MEAVQTISGGATALSTMGLYAICATLAIVVVHFYRRLNQLEKEFRDALIAQTERQAQSNAEMRVLVEQTQEIIRANTTALEKFYETRGEDYVQFYGAVQDKISQSKKWRDRVGRCALHGHDGFGDGEREGA